MSIESTIIGEIRVILMPGRLDTTNVQETENELRSFALGEPRKIVIDLSRTEYVASAGLRVILQMTRDLMKNGGAIALAGLKPPVRKIFEMAGFTSIFRICATQEEALATLK